MVGTQRIVKRAASMDQTDEKNERVRPGTITVLLERAREGEHDALAEAWTILYGQLRKVAYNLMRGESLASQVDATELISELWIKSQTDADIPKDRKQFFGRACRHMARELVGHARKRDAQKRGGSWSKKNFEITVGELRLVDQFSATDREEAARLMAYWEQLYEELPETATVAFFRLALDLTNSATAKALAIEPKQASRDWILAKDRHFNAMNGRPPLP